MTEGWDGGGGREVQAGGHTCTPACVLSLQSCLTLYDPMDCSPPGIYPWDSPRKNTGVGCRALLQGIFPTQGLKPCFLCLLRWQGSFYHLGNPDVCMKWKWKVAQLCPTLCDPMDQAPPSMEFSRQEYWSGLPFPPPGDLPDPGIEPVSHTAGRCFTVWATRDSQFTLLYSRN